MKELDLAGRVAVVIGGTSGIGLALAQGLAAAGADVVPASRRPAMVQEAATDGNQCWDMDEAITQMRALARFHPWWIEEPTSPDDVLGHARIAREVAPISVATGEVCQNRVMFKQLLQADAFRYVQVDSCCMGGVNEALAVMLMAHKFRKPVCPHAGRVGLCEYVDHLHEHFVDPCFTSRDRYVAPLRRGCSIEIKPQSIADYTFPNGSVWTRDGH
jgi:L-fuconate dehydratase